MANNTAWKLCTNSFCDGPAVASGKLPRLWAIGSWHRLSLMLVNTTATARMDGHVFYTGGATIPKSVGEQQHIVSTGSTRDRTSMVHQPLDCESNTTILPKGQMLVGGDYRRVQLQSDPADVKHCVSDCCKDPLCVAWAVSISTMPTSATCRKGTVCCFLKTHGFSQQPGTREIACGVKHSKSKPPAQPPLPFGGEIPPSGWAALISTLGGVQFDNFELDGRSPVGGSSVATCSAKTRGVSAGDDVVSLPCDVPGALTAWDKLPGGQVQLRSTTLCLTTHDGLSVQLAPCAGAYSATYILHNRTTGQ